MWHGRIGIDQMDELRQLVRLVPAQVSSDACADIDGLSSLVFQACDVLELAPSVSSVFFIIVKAEAKFPRFKDAQASEIIQDIEEIQVKYSNCRNAVEQVGDRLRPRESDPTNSTGGVAKAPKNPRLNDFVSDRMKVVAQWNTEISLAQAKKAYVQSSVCALKDLNEAYRSLATDLNPALKGKIDAVELLDDKTAAVCLDTWEGIRGRVRKMKPIMKHFASLERVRMAWEKLLKAHFSLAGDELDTLMGSADTDLVYYNGLMLVGSCSFCQALKGAIPEGKTRKDMIFSAQKFWSDRGYLVKFRCYFTFGLPAS